VLHEPMHAETEALIMFAARREHLEQVIRPALAAGEVVISDRFTDASFAYQCGGRGLPEARLSLLEQWVHGDLQPDLTLLFDLAPEIAAQRMANTRTPDRFEREQADFHRRVRDAYLRRAEQSAPRIRVIDGSRSLEEVRQQLQAGAGGCGRDPSLESAPVPAVERDPERMPHALLLHGPAGVGKRDLGLGLAQWFLCEAPRPTAPAALRCLQLVRAGQSSRLSLGLEPQEEEVDDSGKVTKKASKEIKVEQVREHHRISGSQRPSRRLARGGDSSGGVHECRRRQCASSRPWKNLRPACCSSWYRTRPAVCCPP
jgi:dTMP kinase